MARALLPSNRCVKGPSNISMFALAKELQRSWHFQRTFSKHQIGSPRWGVHSARQREGPAAFGHSASDTITLSQSTARMLHSSMAMQRVTRHMELVFPSGESIHQGQGACTGYSNSWTENNWVCPRHSCCAPSLSLAEQDSAEGCTPPADAVVSETILLSGHKIF